MNPNRRAFRGLTAALLTLLLLLSVRSARAEDEGPTAEEIAKEEEAVLRRARGFERSVVRLVRKIRPATVSIENWQGRPPRPVGSGSGVVISRRGHILTNVHVIQRAKRVVVVSATGERLEAEVVGTDVRGDIALLQVDAEKRLKYVNPKRGDTRKLAEGSWVLATGNPFSLGADGESVVTLGIVSGLGRVTTGQFMYGDSIQHDAEINPGNSGGPLFDLDGELLGINGRIATSSAGGGGPSSSGVGYTIPMHQIRNFLDRLMDGEKGTRHGDEIVGLQVKTSRDEDGLGIGVEVVKVAKGSPAEEEKMQPGDVIWKISAGGKSTKIVNQTQYFNVMSTLAEGSKVSIYARRGRRKVTFRMVLVGRSGR